MKQQDLMKQLHTIEHGGCYEVIDGAIVRVSGPALPGAPGAPEAAATAEGGAGAAVGAANGEPPSPPEEGTRAPRQAAPAPKAKA